MTTFFDARRARTLVLLAVVGAGCGSGDSTLCTGSGCDGGAQCVAGQCVPVRDAGPVDPGPVDPGPLDSGPLDSGPLDSGPLDSGPPDAGPLDAGPPDAGPPDAGPPDAGPPDSGLPDAGLEDAGPACVPGSVDLPDDQSLDTNCDGIDGDASQAVFVDQAGDDALNDGSFLHPFATVARALQTGKAQVLVSGSPAGDFTLRSGGVYGGYESASAWARTGARTQLLGRVRIEADGGSAVLDSIVISGQSSSQPGSAAVSLTIINATSAVVVGAALEVRAQAAPPSGSCAGLAARQRWCA